MITQIPGLKLTRIIVEVPSFVSCGLITLSTSQLTHNLFLKNVLDTGSVDQLSNPVLTIPGTSTIGCRFFSPSFLLASSPTRKSRLVNAFLAVSRAVRLLKRSRGSRLDGMLDMISEKSVLVCQLGFPCLGKGGSVVAHGRSA